VDTLYKRKADKVQPVNLNKSDKNVPGGSIFWREEIIKKELKDFPSAERGSYPQWLIPKFSKIEKGNRLTPERIEKLIVKNIIPQERNLFMAILYNRETALAWDFTEIGKIKPEISLPVQIRTVDHKAWYCAGFPIPKALNQTVIEMLNNRVNKRMLESCHGPYRNPWFLVTKKNGKYRLVNHAVKFNKITIRDANLFPAVNSFSEEFAGYTVVSLIDFFSGYD
jgi:hypothetical protein